MVLSRTFATGLRFAQPSFLRSVAPIAARPLFATARGFSTKYSKSHEYATIRDGKAFVGISDFAQAQLGDVVYVELPEAGTVLKQGDMFGSVESVKAASDVYLPLGGEILEVNSELETNPEKVNEDPENDAWFVTLKVEDESQMDDLMDAEQYQKFCEEEESH